MAAIATVAAVVVAAVVIYAQTRPTSDTAWTGFPRRQSCSLSPTADETLQGNPIYVSGVPAQSVQAEEVFIEDLGDSTVRLTVTFAGTPEPVQQVLVPGHGDQRFPEPAAWGFTIELFPQGFGAKYPPPIYFHSNDDNPGWSGWQVDGLDGEARFLPVEEWGFAGRTFTLTADLSGYFGIPKGDEFSTDIWVRPLQHNAPPTAYEPVDRWNPFYMYPAYACPQASVHKRQNPQPTTSTSGSIALQPRSTSIARNSPQQFADMDELGFRNSHARCDADDEPAATARTSQSQLVICVRNDYSSYYRGVRLSDQAPSEYWNVQANYRGWVVTNGSVSYTISEDGLVIADGGDVLADEAMIEYRAG
ncbi:MAG: hypothetical protein KAH46_29980 [Mycobacterium sp.]|nr:hypothetical protein [Mycobacterium sp.]